MKKWYHAYVVNGQGENFELGFVSAELEGTLGLLNSCMKAIENEHGNVYARTCVVKSIEYIGEDDFYDEEEKEFVIEMFELLEEYLADEYDNINFLEIDYRAGYDRAIEDVHDFFLDLVDEEFSVQDMYDEYGRR